MKQFAYHCTDIDPETIKSQGFKSGNGGFTEDNVLKDFYDQYLPANPMFVSSLDVKVWDPSSKHCIKVDISGLKKYPDFGHLLDFGAYYDEDCFWWKSCKELKSWLHSSDDTKKSLARYVLYSCDDLTLPASQFTGAVSFNVIGTCCVDGNQIDKSRIVEIVSKNRYDSKNFKTIYEQVREWAESLSKLREDEDLEKDFLNCPYLYVTKLNTSLNPPCRKAGRSRGEKVFKKLRRYSTPVPQDWVLHAVVFMDKDYDISAETEKDFISDVAGNTQLVGKELVKIIQDEDVNKGIAEFLRQNTELGIRGIALSKDKFFIPEEFNKYVKKKKAVTSELDGDMLKVLSPK